MNGSTDDRQLVLAAQSRLEEWTNDARTTAYAELFAGDDALLAPADVRTLDAVDSALEREGGDGVWGTDRHGIHTGGSPGSDSPLGVVCVHHPRVTEDTVLRGVDGVDDETEERLNDALWRYGERVAALVETELEAFVRRWRGER